MPVFLCHFVKYIIPPPRATPKSNHSTYPPLHSCVQVPGNRIAHFSTGGPFTAPQLKIVQEILAVTAFAVFSIVILKERLRWSDYLAFALIICGEYSPATSAHYLQVVH